MGAYNFVNGVQACASPALLKDILKGEWGFAGLVVSDWGALKEGAGPGRHGLDLEMPGPGAYFGNGRLAGLVEVGEVPAEEVDDKARRILRFLDWCGALDGTESTEAELDTPEQRDVARRVAAASLVLLANDGTLPLDASALTKVAVIGPNAEDTAALGGGSATVSPYYTVSILEGLRARLGAGVEVVHEPGFSIRRAVPNLTDDLLAEGRFTVEVFAGGDEPVNVLTDQPAANLLLPDSWAGFDGAVRLRGRGTFVVPESGTWRLSGGGLHEMRMSIDGVPATDNSLPGAINAGLGNHASLVDRDLEAGQEVDLAFEYVVPPGNALALLFVGAAPVTDADPTDGIQAAVDAAAGADVAVVVVGSNDEWESEGSDRVDLELPMGQDELVRRVAAANPRTVVVHNSGSPMLMPWVDDVAAVLQAWYPGQEGGNAVADVLFGDVDPAGRMPTTWPKRLEDTPAFAWYPGEDGHVTYGEGLRLGHRWYLDQELEPQWWFGHGLSYTTFEWGETGATASTATVVVTNTGDRRGTEVVQAYVERPEGAVRVLAGFAKVTLDADESTTVSVDLSPAAYRTWDTEAGAWVTGAGPFRVGLGRSAADVVPVGEVTTG